MRLMAPFLLFCSIALGAVEEGERDRLHSELARTLVRLRDGPVHLSPYFHEVGIPFPAEVRTTFSTWCRLGEDVLDRLADPSAEIPAGEYDGIKKDLVGLQARFEAIHHAVLEYVSSARTALKRKETAESIRHRDFLRQRIDRLFSDIADGTWRREDPGRTREDEDQAFRTRLHYYEMGSTYASPPVEYWPLVPKDAPALREYLDHCAAVCTEVEIALQQGTFPPANDAKIKSLVGIDPLFMAWLELVNEREESRNNPAEVMSLPAFQAALAAEEQAMGVLIAHHRAKIAGKVDIHQREVELRRAHHQRNRLTEVARNALHLDRSIMKHRQHFAELAQEMPPAFEDRVATLGRQHPVAVASLTKALSAGIHTDALQARAELRMLRREAEYFTEEMEQARQRAAHEQEWRARAGEPGVAAALARFEDAWNAMAAARARQLKADLARVHVGLAWEIANDKITAAQFAKENAEHELRLARQQVENPPPDGDNTF